MNMRDILDKLKLVESEEPTADTTQEPVKPETKRKSLAKEHGEVFSIDDAVIDVDFKAEFAPRPQSVIEFYVPKELRGQGIGTKLLQMAVAKYPMLGGQVSSMASLKVFYNLDFRNPSIPKGSIQDHVDIMNDYSSVYMAHTDDKGVPYSKLKTESVDIRTLVDTIDKLESEILAEKSLSKAQQRLFGAVKHAQETGDASSPKIAKMAKSISKSDVKDFASTKHKGLPEKKKK